MVSAEPLSAEPAETIRVDLQLRTGGGLSGAVAEHTDHGLVVMHERTPYVFAWNELAAGSAHTTKLALMALARGGRERLSAEDYFELGMFALSNDRNDQAAREFKKAKKLDPRLDQRISEAFDEFRRRRRAFDNGVGPFIERESDSARPHDSQATPRHASSDAAPAETTSPGTDEGPAVDDANATGRDDLHDEIGPIDSLKIVPGAPDDVRDQVLNAYRAFGARVQEVISRDVVLIESDHFLIWTDWTPRHRESLAHWCEAMYAALCAQFDLDASDSVFLAKCPVFCWRSQAYYRKFARLFDGYDGVDSVGYSRSIEASGHVHIVLLRQGRTELDFNRFACTLVHEGTHAFLHRLSSTHLIPHWVNEGYADLMTERVLGDRCNGGEKARLLAAVYARYDWPIGDMLRGTGPIETHQYPIAQSVVSYLESLGRQRFARFIMNLKAGENLTTALVGSYDGMTLDGLEAAWRNAVRASDPRGGAGQEIPAGDR